MAEKVSVKGDDMAPIYKWLVEQSRELAKAEQGTTSKDLVWKDIYKTRLTGTSQNSYWMKMVN
jgi:glutathione peroxidase-family protein